MPMAADANAVYTMHAEGGQATLWRYPLDGSAPTQIAQAPRLDPVGFSLLYAPPTLYAGSLPMLVGPGFLLQGWPIPAVIGSFGGDTYLAVQWVAVP
jgi:hypothetical protein